MAESQSFSGKEASVRDCANGFHKILACIMKVCL